MFFQRNSADRKNSLALLAIFPTKVLLAGMGSVVLDLSSSSSVASQAARFAFASHSVSGMKKVKGIEMIMMPRLTMKGSQAPAPIIHALIGVATKPATADAEPKRK